MIVIRLKTLSELGSEAIETGNINAGTASVSKSQ